MTDYPFLKSLQKATSLAEDLAHVRSSPASLHKVQRVTLMAAELLHDVLTWTPQPSQVLQPFANQVDAANEVWRNGLLCYMYAELFGLPSSCERIQKSVQKALPALFSLSWLQQVQWPLYMIAVHALKLEDQCHVREILQHFSHKNGFQASISAQGILDRVWEQLDRDASGLNLFKNTMYLSKTKLNITL